jgi:hypothetical protein
VIRAHHSRYPAQRGSAHARAGPSPRGARGCRGPGAPEPFVGRQYVGSATSSWTYPGPCDASPRLQMHAGGGPRMSGHPVRAPIHPLRGPISPVQLLTAEPMTKRASDRRGARCRLQPLTGRQIVLSSAPPARLSAIRSRRKRVVCAQGTLRRAQIALGALHPCSDRSDVEDTKTALTTNGDSKVVDDSADGPDLGFRKQQVLSSNLSVGSTLSL